MGQALHLHCRADGRCDGRSGAKLALVCLVLGVSELGGSRNARHGSAGLDRPPHSMTTEQVTLGTMWAWSRLASHPLSVSEGMPLVLHKDDLAGPRSRASDGHPPGA